jgi:hypothetical protein
MERFKTVPCSGKRERYKFFPAFGLKVAQTVSVQEEAKDGPILILVAVQ